MKVGRPADSLDDPPENAIPQSLVHLDRPTIITPHKQVHEPRVDGVLTSRLVFGAGETFEHVHVDSGEAECAEGRGDGEGGEVAVVGWVGGRGLVL